MQVVLVGAGMDTRAWRLPATRGVNWFEVDQERVLNAKLDALRRAHTQVSHLNDDDTLRRHLTCWAYQTVGAPLRPVSLGTRASTAVTCALHDASFALKPSVPCATCRTEGVCGVCDAARARRAAACGLAQDTTRAAMQAWTCQRAIWARACTTRALTDCGPRCGCSRG